MPLRYAVTASVFLAIAGVAFFFSIAGCVPHPASTPTDGSHGLRTFSTDVMVSFLHNGERICVESGWKAVGANVRFGGALFEREKTGVLIRENTFGERYLPETSTNGYHVRFLYPKNTSREDVILFSDMIARSFDVMGSMYATQKERHPFMVVLTSGVSSTTDLYPDPTGEVAYITKPYEDTRTEELLLHAVMHAYNRFDNRFNAYTKYQSPIPYGDFEELEATWAETALNSSKVRMRARLAYLYGEYRDPTESVTDEAHQHYIVSPLVMLAVEGLLQRSASQRDVRAILSKVHQGERVLFLDELANLIGTEWSARVYRWLYEKEPIPYDLLLTGIQYYERNTEIR